MSELEEALRELEHQRQLVGFWQRMAAQLAFRLDEVERERITRRDLGSSLEPDENSRRRA